MLKINNTESETSSEQSDIVGRFRSGYQVDGTPASLGAFRVTTGDASLADQVAEAFGLNGDIEEAGPQEWDATGEDYIEVFTAASSVNVILESADSYRAQLVRRTKDGDFMYATDGEVILAVGEDYEDEFEVGQPDPQADQDLDTRKAKQKKGLGAGPDIRINFLIEGHEDWGTFQFRTGGWSLVYTDPEPKLRRQPEGRIRAQLKLTEVKGKKFTWVKPELVVRGSTTAKVKPAPAEGETAF